MLLLPACLPVIHVKFVDALTTTMCVRDFVRGRSADHGNGDNSQQHSDDDGDNINVDGERPQNNR